MAYKLAAGWENDCQGKKNYDGNILGIDTRYWPSAYDRDGLVTAKSHLVLWHTVDSINQEYEVLNEKEFKGATKEEVQKAVEYWAQTQMNEVLGLLRKRYTNLFK